MAVGGWWGEKRIRGHWEWSFRKEDAEKATIERYVIGYPNCISARRFMLFRNLIPQRCAFGKRADIANLKVGIAELRTVSCFRCYNFRVFGDYCNSGVIPSKMEPVV